MGNDTLFSIIIPIYNTSEIKIYRCLRSILCNNYQNFQILVIDDGSRNRCSIKRLIENIDAKIIIIETDHMGLASARNVGIAQATGEYILFVDADDFVSSKLLECLELAIRKNRECDLIVFPWEHISSQREGRKTVYDVPEMITVAVWNKCYRRTYVSKFIFLENFLYEDIKFTFEVFFNTRKQVYFLKQGPLYFYEEGADGTITGNMKAQDDALQQLNAIAEILLKEGGQSSKRKWITYIYTCWIFHVKHALVNLNYEVVENFVSYIEQFEEFDTRILGQQTIFERAKWLCVFNCLRIKEYDKARLFLEARGVFGRARLVYELINLTNDCVKKINYIFWGNTPKKN